MTPEQLDHGGRGECVGREPGWRWGRDPAGSGWGRGHVQGTVLGIKESVYTWKSVCEGVCVCVCLDVCEYTWNESRDRGNVHSQRCRAFWTCLLILYAWLIYCKNLGQDSEKMIFFIFLKNLRYKVFSLTRFDHCICPWLLQTEYRIYP